MKLNLKRNSIWAIAEVVVSGASLFFLYRYIVATLGVKSLGIWSLVLATTSLARLGDIGASAGLSRFVAIAMARGNVAGARSYVSTALVANLVIFAILGGALFYPFWVGIRATVPAASVDGALSLLPYAVVSFVFMNLNATTQSALVGLQRSDLKSMVVIASLVVQLSLTILFVPHFGLVGVAWGQVGQYVVATALAWVIFERWAARAASGRTAFFSKASFRELIGFGAKLQVLNLMNFVFDPATKFVLTSICGLEALGIYEMASRMVIQVRNAVVAPSQALVPAFAHLDEVDSNQIGGLYAKATAITIIFSVPIFLALALASPLIGMAWIGRVDHLFVVFTFIFCAGWAVNAIASPSYLLGVSKGIIRWNLLGNVVSGLVRPALAIVTGILLGPIGVVAAVMAGMAGGLTLAMVGNSMAFGISVLPAREEFASVIRELRRYSGYDRLSKSPVAGV